jgi:hypothetical protein
MQARPPPRSNRGFPAPSKQLGADVPQTEREMKMPEGKPAGRYGRPPMTTRARPPVRRVPTPSREQVLEYVADETRRAVTKELKAELAKRAKKAKRARGEVEKSRQTDLAGRMAAQAASTRQRQQISELQERFTKSTDPFERMQLGSQITFERLRLAHREGRI